MPNTTIGPEQGLATLVVEFEFAPEQKDDVVAAIKRAVTNTVSKQPGFKSNNLHLSTAGDKILNYFQWENAADIDRFFGNEEVMDQVFAEIGQFNPTPRTYDIVFGVDGGN